MLLRAVVLILALVPSTTACRRRPARPDPAAAVAAAAARAAARELVAQADTYFAQAHLYGWRMAERLYAKAYTDVPEETIRQKLRLARLLVTVRQIEEEIADPALDSRVEQICADVGDLRDLGLCDLARHFRDIARGNWNTAPPPDSAQTAALSPFTPAASTLDAFLQVLWVRSRQRLSSTRVAVDAPEAFKASPLFLYHEFGAATLRQLPELEQIHPRFAELFVFSAELLVSGGTRLAAARAYFNRALELIPDYTRAHTGIGNIHLFALEDYEAALEHYRAAARFDEENTAALFGIGACLHHLERLGESNAALDRMLHANALRRGRASQSNVRYFDGEGRYYKAYNHYLSGDRATARELVDAALVHVPQSEQAHYLSGVLYFEAEQLARAREEFDWVTRRGSGNCHAHYYIGRIERMQNVPAFADGFLRACTCVEGTVRNLDRRIQSAANLDLDSAEKDRLRARLRAKLADYRRSSAELIRGMVRLYETGADDPDPSKTRLMNEFAARLDAALNP